MNYLYIHIGRNKTGTTSLQKFLNINANILKEYGFEYKKYKNSNNFNELFSDLSYSKIKSYSQKESLNKLEEARKVIAQTINSDHNNIISSEALSNLDYKSFNYIFGDYPTILISYVRNEFDYIASTYQQFIKANWTNMSFHEYLSENRILTSLNESFINWLYKIDCSKLKVRKYARESLYMNDIRHDFLSNILHISQVDKFKFQDDSNLSISDEVMEFKIKLYEKHLDEFKDIRNIIHFVILSKEFGAKFRIPKSKKNELLDIIKESKIDWGKEFGFAFDFEDYAEYTFSEKQTSIDFKLMFNRFIKIIKNYPI